MRAQCMATTIAKRNSARRKKAALPQSKKPSSDWQLRRAGRLQLLMATPLAALDWLVHGFSTRPGGASELASERNGNKVHEEVLNLGFAEWDSLADMILTQAKPCAGERRKRQFPGGVFAETSGSELRLERDSSI